MQKTIATIALGFYIAWASGAEAQDAQSWWKSESGDRLCKGCGQYS